MTDSPDLVLELPEPAGDDEGLAPLELPPTDPDDASPQQLADLALAGESEAAALSDPTPDDPTDHITPAPLGLISVPSATGTISQMRARVQAWAETQVGVVEDPPYSNHVRYWADMYPAWQGSSWCACFASEAWARVGIDLRTVLGTGAYYCPAIEAMGKRYGAWHPYGSGYDPQGGDLTLYGKGEASHIGLAAPTSGDYSGYRTIEGNTSPGTSGSQTNGGGVYRRYRNGSFIRGWIDMAALITALVKAGKLQVAKPRTVAAASTTPARPPISLAFMLRAITGPDKGKPNGNLRIYQGLLNDQGWTHKAGYDPIPLTGVWSDRTRYVTAAVQRSLGYSGADADGIPGPQSFAKVVSAHWTPTA